MSTYEKAVFVNTVAAAASPEVHIDFSGATFQGFYYGDNPTPSKNTSGQILPFGIYSNDYSGRPVPQTEQSDLVSWRYADIWSIEVQGEGGGRVHLDVDLFRGTPNLLHPTLAKNRNWGHL